MNLQFHVQPATRSFRRLQGTGAAFWVTAAVLGGATLLFHVGGATLKIKHGKKALPLRAPLASLDEEALRPYRVLQRHTPEPEVVKALGTTHYLNWTLEDTSVDERDPLRFVNLFVTYYSGGHDLVPHTPDVCYLGAGYNPAQRHENMDVSVRMPDGELLAVPIRLCTFVKTSVFKNEKVSVVYTFHCNGRLMATRTDVRLCVNDPRNAHAFFSKVEVSFPLATRERNVEGARRLFSRVLPVLVRDHWPDFETAERAAG